MKLHPNQSKTLLSSNRKILIDGVAYLNINGLYKICKNPKDAEFIYKVIMNNLSNFGSPKAYIFLDGYELILKKRNIYNLGITINENFDLLSNLASKISKDVEAPKISLKFTGMFLYRNYQNSLPYLVACEDSRINNQKVSFRHQYSTELFLSNDYLIESSLDGSLLPLSTQLFNLDFNHNGMQHENYLYFYGKDVKDIIKKYFACSDPHDFLDFNAERVFRDELEINIDLNKKKSKTKLSKYPIFDKTHEFEKSSNDPRYETNTKNINSQTISKPEEILIKNNKPTSVSYPIKKRFKSTALSFIAFIVSFKKKNLSTKVGYFHPFE